MTPGDEANFWKERYDEQHRTLHSAEDEIARLRKVEAAAMEIVEVITRTWVWTPDVQQAFDRLRAVLDQEGLRNLRELGDT